jgi:putative membrane protein
MEETMIRSLLAGAACLALLAACNQERTPEVVDKAQDMAAGPVGQTSAATVGSNLQSAYIPSAAIGDMYEIAAADIALERSRNARVKELARMIKTDHTAASDAMKAMLPEAAPGTTPPAGLDERRQGLIDNLGSASAENFDAAWIDQQIAAHNEALTLHRGFSNEDSPLAAHARSVVPKIEAHLRMAEEIKAAM